MTSKIILSHPLVENCEDAQSLFFDDESVDCFCHD